MIYIYEVRGQLESDSFWLHKENAEKRQREIGHYYEVRELELEDSEGFYVTSGGVRVGI